MPSGAKRSRKRHACGGEFHECLTARRDELFERSDALLCMDVAVLETGATSWTAILDAVRLGPADDVTAVTADQLREVVERLIAAGQWQIGDPDIVIGSDAGYDVTRLARVLRDLAVELSSSWAGSAPTASCGCRNRPGCRG